MKLNAYSYTAAKFMDIHQKLYHKFVHKTKKNGLLDSVLWSVL